jgi:hypothetical protein
MAKGLHPKPPPSPPVYIGAGLYVHPLWAKWLRKKKKGGQR